MDKKVLYNLSYGLYVVSSATGERRSGYVANTAFQVTSSPAQLCVACNKNNFTSKIIDESGKFSVSILREDIDMALLGSFGFRSGESVDKFQDLNYKIINTVPVLLDGSLGWLSCEVIQKMDMGSHNLYLGKIIESEMIEEKLRPLTYDYYHKIKNGTTPPNAPSYVAEKKSDSVEIYKCSVCGYEYDATVGDEKGGIVAGTSFGDLPDSWRCPICGQDHTNFNKI